MSYLQELRLYFASFIANIVNSLPRADLRIRLFNSDMRYNLFYLFSGGNPQYTCTAPSNVTRFEVQMCATQQGSINGTQREIATAESSSTVTVSSVMPNVASCSLVESGMGVVSIQEVRLCSSNIAPFIPWYQYVIDFALGQGIFNETVLFYGRYGNVTYGGYNLPVAYLFMMAVVYAISVALLVYK